jgi:hypothetical protein
VIREEQLAVSSLAMPVVSLNDEDGAFLAAGRYMMVKGGTLGQAWISLTVMVGERGGLLPTPAMEGGKMGWEAEDRLVVLIVGELSIL